MNNLEDETFTNNDSIQYPSLNDIADIRVINNNIKILNEQKANLDNLSNVARESSPKNIENTINTMNTKLSSVAIETSPKNIENLIKSINTKISNTTNIIKSVQRGVRNFTSTSSQSISISTINPQKSIVILNGGVDQNVQSSIGIIVTSATPYLLSLSSSSISIGISVYNGSSWANTLPVSWQVIEFY